MNRAVPILFISLLIPASTCLPTNAIAASAPASFSAASSLLSASSSPGNAYAAGFSVVITAPVAGDLSAVGGGVIAAAPIAGDEFLLAGSISSRAPVAGDFRAMGGSITIEKPIGGDLVAFGLSVYDVGRPGGSVLIVALNPSMESGAVGPVTIYGNSVSIAGDFSNDVTIVASGRVTLAASTTIRGALSYEASEEATIPISAVITGGVVYKNLSYLPNSGTSRALSLISVWFFLLARILGALILAGLLAGLFPRLAEAVAERIYGGTSRSILLTLLLGFAILVATPILLAVLALTFIGIGIALLIFVAYVFLLLLAFLYGGILLGSVIVHSYARRETVLWHDGVLGMLVLSLIALIPIIGLLIVFLLTTFAAGSLLLIFFDFAFPHENETPELL